jgi:hypothetical protein
MALAYCFSLSPLISQEMLTRLPSCVVHIVAVASLCVVRISYGLTV